MIEVFPRGTKVLITQPNIKAVILAICIRGDIITYDCSYFHNGESKSTWLSELEFVVQDYDHLKNSKIGFKGCRQDRPTINDFIENADISIRLCNMLKWAKGTEFFKRNNLEYLDQLFPEHLLQIGGVGKKSMDEFIAQKPAFLKQI